MQEKYKYKQFHCSIWEKKSKIFFEKSISAKTFQGASGPPDAPCSGSPTTLSLSKEIM